MSLNMGGTTESKSFVPINLEISKFIGMEDFFYSQLI